MTRNSTCAALRAVCHRPGPQVVRSISQFGPVDKPDGPYKLFLDDARNPPLNEKGWVVVRTVADGIDFLTRYGSLVTEISFDNDLNADPQGIELLRWVLSHRSMLPMLTKCIVHTGNMPQWRKMMELLRHSGLIAMRRVPSDRIYPRASSDVRPVQPYKE